MTASPRRVGAGTIGVRLGGAQRARRALIGAPCARNRLAASGVVPRCLLEIRCAGGGKLPTDTLHRRVVKTDHRRRHVRDGSER